MSSTPSEILEQIKIMSEYLKHIASLSTASLVLLTIFLEKLFNKPRWKGLITIALSGFGLSLVGSVVAFNGLLQPLPSLQGNIDTGSRYWVIGGSSTSLGFVIGVIALTIFGIRNWHER